MKETDCFHYHESLVVISKQKPSTCCTFLTLTFMFPGALPLGVITVPGDSDLETCRLHIDRLQDNLEQVQRCGQEE